MITQLITAIALQEDQEIQKGQRYLFSFQTDEKGYIRIITTQDIERYYADIHPFLNQWSQVSSLGWAKDKQEFQTLLESLQNEAGSDTSAS